MLGLQLVQIFQGTYTDFNQAWYGTVGAYLLFTFIIQVASVPAYPLFLYLFVYPISRALNYPSVRYVYNIYYGCWCTLCDVVYCMIVYFY